MLKDKKILLGVCGSIAAYKSALLVRLLKKAGAEVQVVMTQDAKEFIGPLTLATLSENPALSDFYADKNGLWNNHVELGLWADLLVIAPATANTLGKIANGLCDNLLSAVYLSARCPVYVCPAMDLDMYAHPSVTANLEKLKSFGNLLIEPGYGHLASGLVGKGRMAEPEEIFAVLANHFTVETPVSGKKILVTAGPTAEAIDPVRYISNRSSGKMGFAIADFLHYCGAEVTVVAGPGSLKPQRKGVKLIKVESAQEMFEAVKGLYPDSDITVFAAAVADYTPKNKTDKKIKKAGDSMELVLEKTKDIAKEMGLLKKPWQINVGFALETDNEVANAQEKLEKKNFDMVILNSLQDKGAGFQHDTNKITIVEPDCTTEYPLKSKDEVAKDIVKKLFSIIEEG